jgi:GNAT superfamily N-acetyltransferase
MINQIEEIQFNAWPALNSQLYDGWVLRLSEGVTRRSNSISPIYASSLDIHKKIDHCEAVFHDAGFPVIFKLTEEVHPPDLDKILEKKGYAFDAETSVQLLDLKAVEPCVDDSVSVSDSLDQAWLERFIEYNGYSKDKMDAYGNIIRRIKPLTGFADLYVNGQHAGCGLGVVQDDLLGLFDIVVAPEFRRKGYGKKLVSAIMNWGKAHGAQTAYLQVMLDNPAGLALYRDLGFKEIYKYWYRVK